MITNKRIASFPCWLQKTTNYLIDKKAPQKLLFFTTSLLATVWFLVRVIPKPSRATYPCMKVAAPLASSLAVWIFSLAVPASSLFSYERLSQKRLFKTLLMILALSGVLFFLATTNQLPSKPVANIVPWFEANKPVGIGKGIHPGRVVWVHDPAVANWDGVTGNWWEDRFNSQPEADKMMSASLISITGEKSVKKAWNALFSSFNETHHGKALGYTSGQKIAVKINENNTSEHANTNEINASPQMVLALLKRLINDGDVPQENITVFDASRFITDNVFEKCHTIFPYVQFVDNVGGDGRIKSEYVAGAIAYSADNGNLAKGLTTVVTKADYLINMALFKGHVGQGVTLCAKNWYGCTNIDKDWRKNFHNNFDQNKDGKPKYMTFVDFMGHKDLGGKTMLYLIDGTYGCKFVNGVPTFKMQMKPFNNDWPSSIFASQDPVAIDAVCGDLLFAEWPDAPDMTQYDMYLQEAALADNPPSGTKYDPEQDGSTLKSLGVFEHWDNADNKQYSGNKNPGSGIELVYVKE
jgi:uncharacterized protein (DUF362 family)